MNRSILPRGWVEQPLEDFAIIERDIIAPEDIETGTKYVGLEHITGEGSLDATQTVKSGQLASAKFRFGPDHLLYGKLRPYLRKIAKPSFDGICSTDIVPLMPRNGKASRNYLFHYLRTDKMIDLATSRSAGANLPRLSPRLLAGFPVVAPRDVDEQERIAAILDKADAIRRKRRQALAEIDVLQNATFAHMFLESGKWPLGQMRELADLINGDRSSNYPSGAEVLSSGVLFLSTKNIRESRLDLSCCQYISSGKFNSLSRGKLERGDVVITLRGSIGQAAIFDCEYDTGFINAQLMIIRPFANARPSYIKSFLMSPRTQAHLARIGSGSAIPQLTARQIGDLRIPSPPMLAQEKFELLSNNINRQHLKTRLLADEADNLFQAISQRAFRGEL